MLSSVQFRIVGEGSYVIPISTEVLLIIREISALTEELCKGVL